MEAIGIVIIELAVFSLSLFLFLCIILSVYLSICRPVRLPGCLCARGCVRVRGSKPINELKVDLP